MWMKQEGRWVKGTETHDEAGPSMSGSTSSVVAQAAATALQADPILQKEVLSRKRVSEMKTVTMLESRG